MQRIHLVQAECQAGNLCSIALVKFLEQLLWLCSCFCSGFALIITLWVQQARLV